MKTYSIKSHYSDWTTRIHNTIYSDLNYVTSLVDEFNSIPEYKKVELSTSAYSYEIKRTIEVE